ncbi:MAG: hypothetical protein WKH64_06830 [Chloroflexia bacterium]
MPRSRPSVLEKMQRGRGVDALFDQFTPEAPSSTPGEDSAADHSTPAIAPPAAEEEGTTANASADAVEPSVPHRPLRRRLLLRRRSCRRRTTPRWTPPRPRDLGGEPCPCRIQWIGGLHERRGAGRAGSQFSAAAVARYGRTGAPTSQLRAGGTGYRNSRPAGRRPEPRCVARGRA